MTNGAAYESFCSSLHGFDERVFMKRNSLAAFAFSLLLILCADISRGQDNVAEEATAVGVSRKTDITIGEGYATGTESIEARITVLEVLRGEKAWDLVKASDSSNRSAPAGMDYVAARIRFEYEARGIQEDQNYAVRSEQFAAVSEKGRQYDRPSIVQPKPELSGRLYPGDSLEGWLVLLVSVDDKKPLMTFGHNYSRTWFKLYR
jgi:hypothetical protein